MQVIIEGLTGNELIQLSQLAALAVSFKTSEGVKALEAQMDKDGYTDNGVVRIQTVNIGVGKKAQLIVKYVYDGDEDEEFGSYYISFNDQGELEGSF